MQIPNNYPIGEPERITLGPQAIPALRYVPLSATPARFPCLLIQHGYGADKYDLAPLAESLAALGCVALLPDAWGHGERFDPLGTNWTNASSADYFVEVIRHVTDDLVAILGDLAADVAIDPTRIILAGFSLGGITSLLTAERSATVAGVLAIAGGVSPDILEAPLGMSHTTQANTAWAQEHDMAAPENAAKLAPRPVLLLHGRQDDRLPVSGSERLFAAAAPTYADDPERLRLRLHDATHEITMQMLVDALEWLSEFFLTPEKHVDNN